MSTIPGQARWRVLGLRPMISSARRLSSGLRGRPGVPIAHVASAISRLSLKWRSGEPVFPRVTPRAWRGTWIRVDVARCRPRFRASRPRTAVGSAVPHRVRGSRARRISRSRASPSKGGRAGDMTKGGPLGAVDGVDCCALGSPGSLRASWVRAGSQAERWSRLAEDARSGARLVKRAPVEPGR